MTEKLKKPHPYPKSSDMPLSLKAGGVNKIDLRKKEWRELLYQDASGNIVPFTKWGQKILERQK